MSPKNNIIGTLQESSLHEALKFHFADDGDKIEQQLDGYIIDIVKPNELVEIQTSSFSSIKNKYWNLIDEYKIRLVYPIRVKKWIVKYHPNGKLQERRKSPKEQNYFDIFDELVSLPRILSHPNFRLHLVQIHEEEIRVNDGKGSWRRRGWSIKDHKLGKIIESIIISNPEDLMNLFPEPFPAEFTNLELHKLFQLPKHQIQKATYILNKMGSIVLIGKKGRYNLYKLVD